MATLKEIIEAYIEHNKDKYHDDNDKLNEYFDKEIQQKVKRKMYDKGRNQRDEREVPKSNT